VPSAGLRIGRLGRASVPSCRMVGSEGGDRTVIDFFISYTRADVSWAKWIDWHLVESGVLRELLRAGKSLDGQGSQQPARVSLDLITGGGVPESQRSRPAELVDDLQRTLDAGPRRRGVVGEGVHRAYGDADAAADTGGGLVV